MARTSEEGSQAGLGWLDAEVRRFSFAPDERLPVPHMGWQEVTPIRASPLFPEPAPDPRFYFSHAYHLVCRDPRDVAATATYGYEFAAAVHRGNILGTQFHPEKSHVFGMEVYRRFVSLPGRMIPRVIPVLLIADGGLVKTIRFRDPRYVGDPINAVRIFNDKQVDELVLLDIDATRHGRALDEAAIEEIASEAFMPVAYGGGIGDVATATRLIQLGVEKVIVNAAAVERPDDVRQIADRLGSSTLVVAMDAAARGDGSWEVVTHSATRRTGIDVRAHAVAMAELGAGELFLTSVDRDGMMEGYDLDLVRTVAGAVDVPVVACGGAGSLEGLATVVRDGGASAAAAGSLFVFHGRHRAVLITYPAYDARAALFSGAGLA